ncbi:MAG: ATP-binding protein [Deltaproteobacteria bacterium]|nr:ATP-binding protein [Deltaproteobacteria bacterium]
MSHDERTRLLMVEDDDDDFSLTQELLHEIPGARFDVERAATYDEAISRTAAGRFDVCLLDYRLGARDGLELLAELTQSASEMPIIVLTGQGDHKVDLEAMAAGAADYLVKSQLSAGVLERCIRYAMERARGHQQLVARERDLRASEARFRTLVDSMEDTVFTLDVDQRVTAIYGRSGINNSMSDKDCLGRTATELWGPLVGALHWTAGQQALTGVVVVHDWFIEDPRGDRHFQTSLAPLRSTGGAIYGLVGVTRNMTAERLMQTQLVSADRMASVGLLAAGVAHEINNPLACITMDLEHIHGQLGRSDASRKEVELVQVVVDARDAANRVREIVSDLQVFSRADEKMQQAVDVVAVLEASIRMARHETRYRARVTSHFGAVPLVSASASRLGQVFLNLIVNAAQAVPDGKPADHEITIRTSTDTYGRAVIEVGDDGPGIPPEVLARLFVPFFTTKPVGVGTGLGLSIARRIVRSKGGELTLESEVGKGTIARVLLPAAVNASAANPTQPETVPR